MDVTITGILLGSEEFTPACLWLRPEDVEVLDILIYGDTEDPLSETYEAAKERAARIWKAVDPNWTESSDHTLSVMWLAHSGPCLQDGYRRYTPDFEDSLTWDARWPAVLSAFIAELPEVVRPILLITHTDDRGVQTSYLIDHEDVEVLDVQKWAKERAIARRAGR